MKAEKNKKTTETKGGRKEGKEVRERGQEIGGREKTEGIQGRRSFPLRMRAVQTKDDRKIAKGYQEGGRGEG